MAPVIQIFPVYIVIFDIDPAGGLHLADALPVLRGHQVNTYAGMSDSASAQLIQIAVILIRLHRQIIFRKLWLIAVDRDICLIRIWLHPGQGKTPLR